MYRVWQSLSEPAPRNRLTVVRSWLGLLMVGVGLIPVLSANAQSSIRTRYFVAIAMFGISGALNCLSGLILPSVCRLVGMMRIAAIILSVTGFLVALSGLL